MTDQMTPLERVSAAIARQPLDRVPVYPLLNGISRHEVGASYPDWTRDSRVTAAAYEAITRKMGVDCVVTLTDLSVEAGDFGQPIVYPEREAAHPDFHHHRITDAAGYRALEPLNLARAARMSNHIDLCARLVERMGQEYPIVAFVFGPLGIVSMLRGQSDLYMDLIDDPEAVTSALEAVTLTLLDYVDRLMDAGVHAVMVDTLFSSQSIMSKRMWDDVEGPYVQRLAEHIHEKGCMVMIHNCGRGIYMDAQIARMHPEAISYLHLPPDCADMAALKASYGQRTTLIGQVDPIWVARASREEVLAECHRELEALSPGGGFILATGCEYPSEASLDGAAAMVEAAHAWGRPQA